MGIVKCRECGNDVSSEAEICPHCGIAKPVAESRLWRYIKLGIGAVLVISMVQCINDQEDRKAQSTAEQQRIAVTKTPEQRQAEAIAKAKKEADFQSVVARLNALRASTKNPKSFELVDAVLMKDDTLCITYRGTNGFNAVVTENKAILKSSKIVEWNRFCANKTGTDMTYARHAL